MHNDLLQSTDSGLYELRCDVYVGAKTAQVSTDVGGVDRIQSSVE